MTTDPLETVSPTVQQRSRFLKELCSNGLTQVHDAKVLVYWLPGNEASTAATRNQVHSNQNPLVRLDSALPLGWVTTMYINQCYTNFSRFNPNAVNNRTGRYWAYTELSAEFILKGEDRAYCGFWGWITGAYLYDMVAVPSNGLRQCMKDKNICYVPRFTPATLRDLYETDESY